VLVDELIVKASLNSLINNSQREVSFYSHNFLTMEISSMSNTLRMSSGEVTA